MSQLEIEIKSLLKSETEAQNLIQKLHDLDPETKLKDQNSQLNHYFQKDGDLPKLMAKIEPLLDSEKQDELKNLTSKIQDYSLRTRQINGLKNLFILKITLDETTSSNGTARVEFETKVDLDLQDLDQMILDCGFSYQSKWSRKRQEYNFLDIVVCVDQNAGYGYLVELEKIVKDPNLVESTKKYLREKMEELNLEELSQDRLARMFDFYNQNWQKYYGTSETFVIE